MSKQLPFFLTVPCNFEAPPQGEMGHIFSGVAYSGGLVEDWYYPVVIDLATTKLASRMPLLFAHERDKNIGAVTTAEIDSRITVGGKVFSDIDDIAKSVVDKADRGAEYQMSIGIFRTKTQFYDVGEEVEVNGKKFSGPVAVMRNGLVREVSVLPLGADDETNAQFFSALPKPKSENSGSETGDSNMPTIEELTSQVAELTKKVKSYSDDLAAAITRAEEAEQKIEDAKLKARKDAVENLFKTVGQEYDDDTIAPILEMSDAAFGVFATSLKKANERKLPKGLFRETATDEPGEGGIPSKDKEASLNVIDIYARRRITPQA